MTKYLWMIVILTLFGCVEKNIDVQQQIDAATIRSTYYLNTIVHDEHLFIISRYGYFIHHMDCPCLKIKIEEKIEPKVELPAGNILDLLKGNR